MKTSTSSDSCSVEPDRRPLPGLMAAFYIYALREQQQVEWDFNIGLMFKIVCVCDHIRSQIWTPGPYWKGSPPSNVSTIQAQSVRLLLMPKRMPQINSPSWGPVGILTRPAGSAVPIRAISCISSPCRDQDVTDKELLWSLAQYFNALPWSELPPRTCRDEVGRGLDSCSCRHSPWPLRL